MTESHFRTLCRIFSKDVSRVTEWRDDCVWQTQFVGRVIANQKDRPFQPGSRGVVLNPTKGERP